MPKAAPLVSPDVPVVFEPEFITPLKRIFEESIAFNKVLGLKIDSITPAGGVRFRITASL